jgi:flagellar hook-associated protein 1 FlgK
MSLTQALNTALAGLNATQTGLSIISGNVANANTPGYVERTVNQVEAGAGGASGTGVDVKGINRSLNSLLQTQLWTETSGGSYADTKAQLYSQLQQVYGTPGSPGAFDTAYNNFTSALQSLSTSPASYSAQTAALGAAQQLTQNLNSMTGGIQALRSQAEQGIADGIVQANQAMQTIAQINQQLSSSSPQDAATATLEDQRDQAVTQLSQLMNVTVVKNSNDQVSVFTNSGAQLVGTQASQLKFDDRGSLSATSLWNATPAKDGAGTITLVAPDGSSTDLIANRSIQSGQIAAYLEMRDQILPQAQSQLDAVAAQMSRSLSDQTTNGSPVTSGSQSGFTVDSAGVLPGNSVQVTYTDLASVQHTVTIVRVDDPAALPLPSPAATNPNNRVVGVNFAGGMASVVAQLNAALGSNLQFSNSGTVLQVLNSPTLNSTVNSVATTTTATALAAGSTQLPLFTDGSAPISGAITAAGSQDVGLAGRIAVNGAVLADPGALVAYQTPANPVGDPTRPNFLLNQLTKTTLTFPPTTGIGSASAPFSGTLADFMGQVTSQQGQAASAASNLQQGQDVVVNALQQRFNSASGVNINTELSNLITLQQAYASNARVMATVQSMFATLMQIGV